MSLLDKKSSTPGTVLEHLGLSSRGGGLGVVLGTPQAGEVNEPHLALGVMDFASRKVFGGHKYQNIVILCLDRDPNWVLGTSDISGKNIEVFVFDSSYSSLNELLRDVDTCINEALKLGNTALIIHSLNELFVVAGEFTTFRWLEYISKLNASTANANLSTEEFNRKLDGSKPNETEERRFVALALCHGATLSPRTVAQLHNTASFVCAVTKASVALQQSTGGSTSGVVAEAYTVRRPPKHVASTSVTRGNDKTSSTVGRSSEGVDFFSIVASSRGEYIYEPCATLRNGKGKDESKKHAGLRQVPPNAPSNSTSTPSSRMLSELAFESGPDDESKRSAEGRDALLAAGNASKVPTIPKPLTKAPIITFDNHDPEFDEDSDPDGDLAF